MSEATASTSGRPRDIAISARVDAAARAVIADGGYAALTVEEVARRAGVARTTVYRRYPSRLALAFASMLHPPKLGPPPDTGSLADDFAAVIEQVLTALTRPGASEAVAAIVAEVDAGADGRHIRDAFIAAERDWIGVVLDRARGRGELTRPVSNDEVIDLLAGPVLYRVLVRGATRDSHYSERLAALVARALGTSTARETG